MGWHLRKPTLIEFLVLMAIVALLVALILPGAQWAADGDIRFPVRVLVFDAVHGTPVADAHVGIFYAPPLLDLKRLEEVRDKYDPTNRVREECSGATNADGTVVIE